MAFISFEKSERNTRLKVWKPIAVFFQRFIGLESSILEIGSGWGEFINQISAENKYSVDIDVSFRQYLDKDINFSVQDVRSLAFKSAVFNHVFASNVFEHLENKPDVKDALREIKRVLKRSGSLIIMQPNFKYCSKEYFDFSDHYTAWTDRSMKELLLQEGFRILYSAERFLPFSTKQKYPKYAFLVSLYLGIPLLWKIFGQQFLIVARKNE